MYTAELASGTPEQGRRLPAALARSRQDLARARDTTPGELTGVVSSGCARLLIILGLFDDRDWGVRELMRAGGLSPSQVETELSRLVALRILATEGSPHEVRYRVATQAKAWAAYRALLRCHVPPGELLPPALSDVKGIEHAFLFGLFAEGAIRIDSDVDVLVVGALVNRRALAARCLAVARLLDRDVNPVVLPPTEWQQMQSARHPFALQVASGLTIPPLGAEPG